MPKKQYTNQQTPMFYIKKNLKNKNRELSNRHLSYSSNCRKADDTFRPFRDRRIRPAITFPPRKRRLSHASQIKAGADCKYRCSSPLVCIVSHGMEYKSMTTRRHVINHTSWMQLKIIISGDGSPCCSSSLFCTAKCMGIMEAE
ncbi:hypothetical protein CDAR_232971 [Caerostris darwini]|uniref:Uncharacterized protein n=1 Tax=Caerostris darwini TaxID=1538125 RepID=A0AAV4Q7G2_9ARAC|nr:hypothetical protein CDAR_232971 [Caerostris darwini]